MTDGNESLNRWQQERAARVYADVLLAGTALPEHEQVQWHRRAYQSVLGGPPFDFAAYEQAGWDASMVKLVGEAYHRLKEQIGDV